MNETTITLIGNVVDEVELKFTPSGVAVAKFRVASTPRTFDKQKQDWVDGTPLFLSCQAWRQMAENCAESLSRGSRVILVGNLTQRSYETREGEKRTVYELDVQEVGPSLKFATATVQKMSRSSEQGARSNVPQGGGEADPWASQPGDRQSGSGGGKPDDFEAPF